jgi:hypothetical protein
MPVDLWEMVRRRAGGEPDPELVDVGTEEEIRRKMNHLAGQIGVPLLWLADGLAFQDGDVTVSAGVASERTIEALRQLVRQKTDEE